MTQQEHRNLGIQLFNETWDLIDKENRSKEEDLLMVHKAHASRFHWEASQCEDLNKARGDWLISRVYNILGHGESAKIFGYASLHLLEKNKIGDFDLVFAYETLAYAYKNIGNKDKVKAYLDLAYKALKNVEKDEDRSYCESELNKI